MNFNLSFRCVVWLTFVYSRISCSSSLHQKMNRCVGCLLSNNLLTLDILTSIWVYFGKHIFVYIQQNNKKKYCVFFITETPLLGPLNEISSSLCNHMTLSGGFSVYETTQLRFTMLPISTNMSGPPITYVEGSKMEIKAHMICMKCTKRHRFDNLIGSTTNAKWITKSLCDILF